MAANEPYKQAIPAIGLSLERGTSRVPSDGHFYVLYAGEIKGRHRSLKSALALYKSIIRDEGYAPTAGERPKADPAKEAVARYMDQLEDYWGSSHKHTRRGGKSMYRS